MRHTLLSTVAVIVTALSVPGIALPQAGPTLTGKVLDAAGKAVPNAIIVSVKDCEPGLAKADKQGAFTLTHVPAGADYPVVAVTPDHSAGVVVMIKSGTAQQDLALVPTIPVSGTIKMQDGKALGEEFMAYVTIQAGDASITLPRGKNQRPIDQYIQAGPDGKFALAHAIPGATYRLEWNYGRDYNDGTRDFVAQAGVTVDVALPRFQDDWKKPGNIAVSDATRCQQLSNYCLDGEDNILACDQQTKRVLKISPEDKLIAAWNVEFNPEAVACRADGTIVVAGANQVAILGADGKKIRGATLPGKAKSVSSAACWDKEIFVCARAATGYTVFRYNEQLEEPRPIIKGLRGCCGVMDITAHDGSIYVAANCDFKIVKYDLEGKELSSFGASVKTDKVAGFDGCCEPKAVFLDRDHNVYTGESAHPGVKKFSNDGKFMENLGQVTGIRGCVRVTTAVSKAGKVYLLDTSRNIIRLVNPPGAEKKG